MHRRTRGKSTAKIVQAARGLRRELTPAERELWKALRSRRLAGLKFRRQHPLDRFILDFFCVEHQLEIEIDGEIHVRSDQAARDSERTEWLQAQGIRVLRFSNEEIEKNLGGVLRRIVEMTSPPAPLLR
ncbi:MAG TPA: endonuclease domain-containing protein [Anaerolineae bacterium]